MKPYINIDSQIILAYSRGMRIHDTQEFRLFLTRKNYYNSVTVYGKYFLVDPGQEKFLNGTTSKEIISVYHFDREVRAILFKKIVEIETNIKSTIVSVFCDCHCEPSDILNRGSYNPDPRYNGDFAYFSLRVNKYINKYYESDPTKTPKNNAIDHYMRHHGSVPLWVLMNYLTFGELCTFYRIMNDSERIAVAKSFRDSLQTSYNTNLSLHPNEVQQYMDAIKDLRNIVAHDNTLRAFKLKTSLPYHSFLHDSEGISPLQAKQDLYSVFLAMKLFLSSSNYAVLNNTIKKRASNLSTKLHTIDCDSILISHGFPKNWLSRPKLPQ